MTDIGVDPGEFVTDGGSDRDTGTGTGRPGCSRHTDRWGVLVPHRQRLVALARRHGAGADAEDVAQEALLRAATSDTIEEQRPGPYLTRIVLNLVADHHRRRTRERDLDYHAGLIPRQRALDDGATDRDRARRALQRLARTEPSETVAMVLRYADGAHAGELAREFGTSASAAKARVLRALRRLRSRYPGHRPGRKNLATPAAAGT